MTTDRPARGIRRTPTSWQAYVRVKGHLYSKRFPLDTDLTELKRWRDERQARAKYGLDPPRAPAAGERSLAQDCAVYLEAVAGMPTFTDRAYRIRQWRDAFGPDRARATITSVEIRQQLERWRVRKPPLSPASLNLRRTALMHLWTVLDGRSAWNPVKDVPRYPERPPALTLPTIEQAAQAIAHVPGVGQKGRTRARLKVLLWTGWPAAQLMQLQPGDVNWRKRVAFVRGRRKGKGTRDRWLPLLPQAVAALKELRATKAWGKFSTSSMHSSLHRGCDAAGVPRFRPYDVRHLFLTTVALATKDDRVVAELGLHADIRQTRRYTEQSVNPRLVEGLQAVSSAIKVARSKKQSPRKKRRA